MITNFNDFKTNLREIWSKKYTSKKSEKNEGVQSFIKTGDFDGLNTCEKIFNSIHSVEDAIAYLSAIITNTKLNRISKANKTDSVMWLTGETIKTMFFDVNTCLSLYNIEKYCYRTRISLNKTRKGKVIYPEYYEFYITLLKTQSVNILGDLPMD